MYGVLGMLFSSGQPMCASSGAVKPHSSKSCAQEIHVEWVRGFIETGICAAGDRDSSAPLYHPKEGTQGPELQQGNPKEEQHQKAKPRTKILLG